MDVRTSVEKRQVPMVVLCEKSESERSLRHPCLCDGGCVDMKYFSLFHFHCPQKNKKDPEFVFFCDTCDRGFKNQEKYDEHLSQHVKVRSPTAVQKFAGHYRFEPVQIRWLCEVRLATLDCEIFSVQHHEGCRFCVSPQISISMPFLSLRVGRILY